MTESKKVYSHLPIAEFAEAVREYEELPEKALCVFEEMSKKALIRLRDVINDLSDEECESGPGLDLIRRYTSASLERSCRLKSIADGMVTGALFTSSALSAHTNDGESDG